MNRIRPAILTVGELFGGVERHVLSLCRWLTEHGTEPRLVVFHDRDLAAAARRQGLVPEIINAKSPVDLSGVQQIRQLIKRERLNILHVHGYRATVNGFVASRGLNVGFVRTVHGLREGTGHVSWAGLKSMSYGLMERWAARLGHASNCYVTDELRRHFEPGGLATRSCVIPNGVEAVDIEGQPIPLEFVSGCFNAVAIGRLTRVKGLEHAIRAAAECQGAIDLHLHLVGTGPDELPLRALARELEVDERVHFAGFQSEVEPYLAHANCLVMPSLHEGLPYTLLEAMAAGCPIVASNTGGLAEILEDGRTALLVPVGDSAGISAAWRHLARDRALAKALSREAQVVQKERFSSESMGGAYWEVYEAACR
jgi:glycosyltransferase involved in cell wall biosynthesis